MGTSGTTIRRRVQLLCAGLGWRRWALEAEVLRCSKPGGSKAGRVPAKHGALIVATLAGENGRSTCRRCRRVTARHGFQGERGALEPVAHGRGRGQLVIGLAQCGEHAARPADAAAAVARTSAPVCSDTATECSAGPHHAHSRPHAAPRARLVHARPRAGSSSVASVSVPSGSSSQSCSAARVHFVVGDGASHEDIDLARSSADPAFATVVMCNLGTGVELLGQAGYVVLELAPLRLAGLNGLVLRIAAVEVELFFTGRVDHRLILDVLVRAEHRPWCHTERDDPEARGGPSSRGAAPAPPVRQAVPTTPAGS